jgi:alpha-L-rhamnosidase
MPVFSRFNANFLCVALALMAVQAWPCANCERVSEMSDSVDALKVDGAKMPLGIDDAAPMFGWQMVSTRNNARQTAYRIIVATDPGLLRQDKPNIWDSGKTASALSAALPYKGVTLLPRQRYFWQVQVWTDQRKEIVSAVSWWETGLMSDQEWHAQWTANDPEEDRENRAADPRWIAAKVPQAPPGGSQKPDLSAQFRFGFKLSMKPVHAYLLITAKENVASWLNGTLVLSKEPPLGYDGNYAWGTFKQVDVTQELRKGENVLAAEALVEAASNRRGELLALLVVKLHDGSVVRFKTGPDWKVASGQQGSWYAPEFSDTSWQQAGVVGKIGDVAFAYPWPPAPASLFRRAFSAHSGILSARLYATALGSYIPYLNGKQVGDQVLAPGWTDYSRELSYQTYDVTALLKPGSNTLGFCLGDGWYASGLVDVQRRFSFGGPPLRFKAQLQIEYKDGSHEMIVTDNTWHTRLSPILKSDLYNGEDFDDRLEDKLWDTGEDPDAGWKQVTLAPAANPGMNIHSQDWPPIRVESLLRPQAITETGNGIFLVDLGQDMVGRERLRVRGPAGQKITLQFGEVLTPEGKFYRANMRGAAEEDTFILNGDGEETFEPSFTYHGFRYIQISGYPGKLKAEDIAGVVFHTDAPFTMSFHTGNKVIDKLVTNILWGQRGNFMSVPTDCPQRDERLGWTGDAQVFWRTASYNMDLDSFSRKFALDMRIAQTPDGQFTDIVPHVLDVAGQGTPGWADAGIVIPWTAYSQYGDTRILEQSWASMQRWMAYLLQHNPSFIVDHKAYGDWLAVGSDTPKDLIGTAFWAYDASLMSKIAAALGKTRDAVYYDDQFNGIAAAFQAKFVHPDGTVGNGSQTSDVLALRMGLLPPGLRAGVADALVADIQRHGGHLTTGFLGTPYLMPVLTETGHADTAFQLLTQDTYPSWEYMVKHGATTMWERWNGDQMLADAGMNSFNHYAYGSVGEWLYRYVAGIDFDPRDPAFHSIVLRPHFDRSLGNVESTYNSPYGAIRSDWVINGNEVTWTASIPANTAATAYLPNTDVHVRDGEGKELASELCVSSGSGSVCKFGAGTYRFSVRQTPQ